jgi:hypothetical protein
VRLDGRKGKQKHSRTTCKRARRDRHLATKHNGILRRNAGGGINHCLLWEAIKIGIEYITLAVRAKSTLSFILLWSWAPLEAARRARGFRLYSTLLELANKWCPKRDNYIPWASRAADKNSLASIKIWATPDGEKNFWRAKFVCVHCVWQRIISLCWLLLGPNEREIHHQPLWPEQAFHTDDGNCFHP